MVTRLFCLLAVAGLAGCSIAPNVPAATAIAARSPVSSSTPRTAGFARPSWYRPAPAAVKKGVYVAEYYTNTVLGYDWQTRRDGPPICSIPAAYVVNVATDPGGDLIDPDGGSRTVTVYKGRGMCGPSLGSFADADGQPSDAVTTNAAHATIFVANLLAAGRNNGNVSVCALATGCTGVLTNAAIGGELFSVAEDANGNVYASGYTRPSSGAALVYWKGGAGAGSAIGAYRNTSPGGLEVDRHGNLLALDTFAGGTGALWVYTGCPSGCTGHGPFALRGESVFGKVDAKEDVFEAADFEYGQINVYRYAGTRGITYLYSYGDGLSPSGDVEGIALDPGAHV